MPEVIWNINWHRGVRKEKMSDILIGLYELAEEQEIDVDWISMDTANSLSLLLPDGSCCIAIDPWKMPTLEKEISTLAHELGHCYTGSFYNRYATCDVRQKHENRADKWAVTHLISKDELDKALSEGHTEIWDLAERFNVTEDFIRKAVCWYEHGNLAVDVCFH